MTQVSMITLDLNSPLELRYLAEGAANVVYRIILPPPSPPISSDLDVESFGDSPRTPPPSEIPPLRYDPRLQGKLLRMRKNLPSLVPVIDSQKYFESVIRPLFPPQNLVDQVLFKPSRDLIKDCNRNLRRMEANGSRARKRHGVYLVEEETYGSLITDMTSDQDDSHVSLEFKPKWLTQSPSAPPDHTRCRTCALRAMKFPKRKNPGEVEHLKLGLCPLNLVSGNRAEVATAANIIFELSQQTYADDHIVRQRLHDFLYTTPLLQRLKDLQTDLDPSGVLQADYTAPKFLTAMTLRDCTLFLKIPRSPHPASAVEARLGDLDLKTSKGGKGEYWRSVERQLVEGGWYTGTETETERDVGAEAQERRARKRLHRGSCQLSGEEG